MTHLYFGKRKREKRGRKRKEKSIRTHAPRRRLHVRY
jgi:hypothetical protein